MDGLSSELCRYHYILCLPAKLCNQRKCFSHDVEMNNKGILDYIYIYIIG